MIYRQEDVAYCKFLKNSEVAKVLELPQASEPLVPKALKRAEVAKVPKLRQSFEPLVPKTYETRPAPYCAHMRNAEPFCLEAFWSHTRGDCCSVLLPKLVANVVSAAEEKWVVFPKKFRVEAKTMMKEIMSERDWELTMFAHVMSYLKLLVTVWAEFVVFCPRALKKLKHVLGDVNAFHMRLSLLTQEVRSGLGWHCFLSAADLGAVVKCSSISLAAALSFVRIATLRRRTDGKVRSSPLVWHFKQV